MCTNPECYHRFLVVRVFVQGLDLIASEYHIKQGNVIDVSVKVTSTVTCTVVTNIDVRGFIETTARGAFIVIAEFAIKIELCNPQVRIVQDGKVVPRISGGNHRAAGVGETRHASEIPLTTVHEFVFQTQAVADVIVITFQYKRTGIHAVTGDIEEFCTNP